MQGKQNMAKPNYKMIVGLWVAAFILAFVSPITAGIFGKPEIAISTLILGVFLALIMILDLKQDRVIKGLFIIMFGVLFQTLYFKIIYIFVPSNTIPQHYKDYLDIYSQVLLFACSGAGGSIIAAHADKSSLDNDSAASREKPPCHDVEIKKLTTTIEKLYKKLNSIITAIASLGMIIIILAVAIFIR